MKKVWVNRFNVNGEVKLMSEWRLKECNHNQSHAYQIASGNYAFNYEGLPPRNCLIAPEGRIEEGGVFFEYIGNQVGDGWFYIERNEIPPFFDVEILLYKNGRCYVCEYDGINYCGEHKFIVVSENSENKYFIFIKKNERARWQPIQHPMHFG